MRISTRSTPRIVLTITVIALAIYCAVLPQRSEAQGGQGQNAVCSSTSVCSMSSDAVGTTAFVDASMFATSADTFCSAIYKILAPPGYSATVIDARGLPGTTGVSMTCASGTTPWNNGSTYVNKPSTILLPAGTITVPTPWVLPANTKLIGIATSGNNSLLDTTIQAASLSSGAVVQFGDSHCPSSGCQGISVEHLSISGDFDEII
jgi:hypothetical protein